MPATAKFCTACGAPRSLEAHFCNECGRSFDEDIAPEHPETKHGPPPLLPRAKVVGDTVSANAGSWAVVVGDSIPESLIQGAVGNAKVASPVRPLLSRLLAESGELGAPLGRQTLWMAGAQVVEVLMQVVGGWGNPYTGTRLFFASATAIFGLTMRNRPHLRAWLVRIGTLAAGALQSASLISSLGHLGSLSGSIFGLLPNLAAQGAALYAMVRLFRSAGYRK